MSRRIRYQQGSVQREKRQSGSDVWVFRWWERSSSQWGQFPGRPWRMKLTTFSGQIEPNLGSQEAEVGLTIDQAIEEGLVELEATKARKTYLSACGENSGTWGHKFASIYRARSEDWVKASNIREVDTRWSTWGWLD